MSAADFIFWFAFVPVLFAVAGAALFIIVAITANIWNELTK